MSTRSLIGILQFDGNIRWTYCHFDGYPEHIEPLLHNYFNTYEKAFELISEGELRSIGEGINNCYYFESDEHPFCGVVSDLEKFLALDYGADYKYLFCNNNWYWCNCFDHKYPVEIMDLLPYKYKFISIYN